MEFLLISMFKKWLSYQANDENKTSDLENCRRDFFFQKNNKKWWNNYALPLHYSCRWKLTGST